MAVVQRFKVLDGVFACVFVMFFCQQKVITGDMLTCRGRVYHTNHFQCNGCKKSLGTEPFHYKVNHRSISIAFV